MRVLATRREMRPRYSGRKVWRSWGELTDLTNWMTNQIRLLNMNLDSDLALRWLGPWLTYYWTGLLTTELGSQAGWIVDSDYGLRPLAFDWHCMAAQPLEKVRPSCVVSIAAAGLLRRETGQTCVGIRTPGQTQQGISGTVSISAQF